MSKRTKNTVCLIVTLMASPAYASPTLDGSCASVALLRANAELEPDGGAHGAYAAEAERRADAVLLPLEQRLVIESTRVTLDTVALERIRVGLIVSRCYDTERVTRDLAFLSRLLTSRG